MAKMRGLKAIYSGPEFTKRYKAWSHDLEKFRTRKVEI